MPVTFQASRKQTWASPGASSGSSVRCVPPLAAVCIATLVAACAEQRERQVLPNDQASSIIEDGAIYTPVAIGPMGCVLYSIEIPGGYAPAALVYRSDEGSFSYARTESCEGADDGR